jgi:3'-phosphoadenosine 5'-phosphosulfate sulfotransferase (PAPS reductase)/FAD synthetase/NOL1/NOP2/fmu family ribosome biogenesis protein
VRRQWFLRWDLKENVPIVSPSGEGWVLRNDFWLMSSWEKMRVEEFVEKFFGVKASLGSRFLVAHKMPSWEPGIDYASEIYGEGAKLGLLIHRVDKDAWAVEGTGALASILEGIGAAVNEIRESEAVSRRLKGKKIKIDTGKCADYCLVKAGDYVGFAKKTADNSYKIKDLARKGFRLLGEPAASSLLNKNMDVLEKMADEAKSFIRRVSEKYGQNEVPVAYSGGADSTALLSLAVEALGGERVIAVYTDTGMEFPETIAYAESVAARLGVRLVVLKSIYDPISEIRRRGIMSVENRWCTRLLKLEALKKFYREGGYRVYLDGARAYESSLREKTPRLSENPYIKEVARALPIRDWPRMLVQLYLMWRGIPPNPLYDEGLTRIGCMVCPAMMNYELKLSYARNRSFHEAVMNSAGLSPEEYLSMRWKGR